MQSEENICFDAGKRPPSSSQWGWGLRTGEKYRMCPSYKKLTLPLSSYISNCLECWLVTKVCSDIKKTRKLVSTSQSSMAWLEVQIRIGTEGGLDSTLETFPPILFSMGWGLRTGEKYRMVSFQLRSSPPLSSISVTALNAG